MGYIFTHNKQAEYYNWLYCTISTWWAFIHSPYVPKWCPTLDPIWWSNWPKWRPTCPSMMIQLSLSKLYLHCLAYNYYHYLSYPLFLLTHSSGTSCWDWNRYIRSVTHTMRETPRNVNNYTSHSYWETNTKWDAIYQLLINACHK